MNRVISLKLQKRYPALYSQMIKIQILPRVHPVDRKRRNSMRNFDSGMADYRIYLILVEDLLRILFS